MQFPELEWFFPFFEGLFLGLVAMALHEGAHIVTAAALGVKVKKVGLKWNKGMYIVRESGPLNTNLVIAFAGPLINLVLISTWHWLPYFALANICYGTVNLLPIQGSDGSRILDCWEALRKRAPVI
jgi:Zn-dependent protease